MSESNAYPQAGDWLIGTAKRNPEALLVLAAGCALLMRGKEARSDSGSRYNREVEQPPWQASPPTAPVTQAAETAKDSVKGYASDLSGRASATAREYASTASARAGEIREAVVSGVAQFPDQARSTVQSGLARVLREQPLAIAALGLAAGATLAAIFPASQAESRVLGPARDAVADAASRAADNVKAAAGEAGELLKEAARERGLDPEGLKGLAREVAGTFADNVGGQQANHNQAPGLVPEETHSETAS